MKLRHIAFLAGFMIGWTPATAHALAQKDAWTAAAVFGDARMEAVADALCGPEGTIDWTGNGPTCERSGWNGRRYIEPCEHAVAYVCEGEPGYEDLKRADEGEHGGSQPWSCETYVAEGQVPFPGCVYETLKGVKR